MCKVLPRLNRVTHEKSIVLTAVPQVAAKMMNNTTISTLSLATWFLSPATMAFEALALKTVQVGFHNPSKLYEHRRRNDEGK